uniref:Transmembrane protein 100 n=1 Tax=Oryzias melastigma TaxID=30732 RepID=A0A3B3DA13_ORYME
VRPIWSLLKPESATIVMPPTPTHPVDPVEPSDSSRFQRLAQATGGTEKSWYRCVFPFGVISLVIGMAGTGVTFSFNTLPQTKVVSVGLLCAGGLMLLVASVCWRAHRVKRRKRKEGDQKVPVNQRTEIEFWS